MKFVCKQYLWIFLFLCELACSEESLLEHFVEHKDNLKREELTGGESTVYVTKLWHKVLNQLQLYRKRIPSNYKKHVYDAFDKIVDSGTNKVWLCLNEEQNLENRRNLFTGVIIQTTEEQKHKWRTVDQLAVYRECIAYNEQTRTNDFYEQFLICDVYTRFDGKIDVQIYFERYRRFRGISVMGDYCPSFRIRAEYAEYLYDCAACYSFGSLMGVFDSNEDILALMPSFTSMTDLDIKENVGHINVLLDEYGHEPKQIRIFAAFGDNDKIALRFPHFLIDRPQPCDRKWSFSY